MMWANNLNRQCYLAILLLVLMLFPALCLASTLTYQIQGLENPALQNAQNRLNALLDTFPHTLSPNDIQEFYEQAPDNLQQAIAPFGYFKPNIRSTLTHQGNAWLAIFQIDPGPVMRITHVQLSVMGMGENDPVLQNYIQHFPLQAGQVLLTEDYKKAKQKLFNLALQQGYLTAYFTIQQIQIDRNRYTSTIILQLNTGPRYYFGPVTFSQTPLSPAFLQRYVNFRQGEPFSSARLAALQSTLSGSNYFQSVEVQSNVENAQNYQVPVNVNLSMRKAKQYSFGLGYGTDTGPRALLGYNWRYVNPQGDYVTSQVVLSQAQSVAQASYVIPGANPATDQYSLNASVMTNDLNQGNSKTEQIGATATRLLSNNWQRTLALNYNTEQFQFNGQPPHTSYLLIPSMTWSNTTKNNQVFVTQGNSFSLTTQGTVKNYLSNNTFFQIFGQDKFITHFTDNDRLILRAQAGYTSVSDIDLFPLSLRYYAGGSQSVRGFSYNAIGPGKYLAVGSTEFQQRIYGNFYGVVFFDTGAANNNMTQAFARSTGIGVVWASPVGTMELTLAKVLNLPGKPLRLQFVMGPDL